MYTVCLCIDMVILCVAIYIFRFEISSGSYINVNYFINMYIFHHSATQDCYSHFNLYSRHVLAITILCCIVTEIYIDEIIDINETGC
jgi:hypothetical protein